MERSKKEYEKPFAHETGLKEKLVRQSEQNVQLDLENGKVEDVDLNGTKERDEDVEDSHVAESNNEYRTKSEGDIRK